MDIEVCYAEATGATRIALVLDAGATVADAIAESRIIETLALDRTQLSFAIFGRRATADAPLHDGDRVELLRPLLVDPKEARHRRVAKKRAQSAVQRDAKSDVKR
jgi:putative ubiquitin-RnfH superfamily antitoxin RatB of RatAB toxin-antitoxin module